MRAYKREEDRKRKIKRCTDGTDIRVQFCPDLSQVFSPSSSFCYIAYATSRRRCFLKIYMQIFLFALSSIVSRAFKGYRETLSPSLKSILIFPYSYRIKVHVFFLTFLKPFFLRKGEKEGERERERVGERKKVRKRNNLLYRYRRKDRKELNTKRIISEYEGDLERATRATSN